MINVANDDSINKILSLEKKSLAATLDIQSTFNKQILFYMKNILGNVEFTYIVNPKSKIFKYLNISTETLAKSNENIIIVEDLMKQFNKVEDSYSDEDLVEKYNSSFSKGMTKLYNNTKDIEEFLHKSSITDFSKILKELKNDKQPKKRIVSQLINTDDLSDYFVEDTLIISEKQKKVILPYKVEDLKRILLESSGKYKTLNDVINEVYTKPIKHYKPFAISRYREAHKLMRKREKASKLKAFSLAMELLGNYNLHPAVIAACKNLDELDVYLACLEDNTLNDFHFFDVKFEIPPTVSN